ncbi:NACHT, LRR and PYD domains-containing protein 3 [Eucyclogobius newberryi]|uniref:NACHT, LRR and PYD domains-containing protein 3 n=1 Tax=Eucyclogobius newberryi TaxID=166745 RepID=UPI003B5A5353
MADPDPEAEMEMPSPTGSFLDEEASASMESLPIEEQEEEEDEDLYYIPERRPSLDLGPRPMETGALVFVERPESPAESYMSMRSEGIGTSVDLTEDESSLTRIRLERTDSFSTCYSVDSDDCEKRTLKVTHKDGVDSVDDMYPELKENLTESPQPSLTIPFVFKAICKVLQLLKPLGLDAFRTSLWQRYPQSFSTALQTMDIVDIVDRMLERYSLRVCLQMTKTLLRELELKRLVDFLEDLEIQNDVRYELTEGLKKTYGVIECSGGDERPLDEVFTDVHIKSVRDNGPNTEHEVMFIQKPETTAGEDLCVKDIFSADFMEKRNEQLILLYGAAGSGKSVIIRKLIHEWSNQKSHDHISLMFPLLLKELKQKFGDSVVSFLDILHSLYPETKRLRVEDYCSKECKIMYIFDGLEEIAEDINFQKAELVFNIQEPAKLNILIANILRDQLLKFGYCLFASRILVDYCIPWDTHHFVYEALGFKEKERDEYFSKRFRDQRRANHVLAYVKSSKTLHVMCHLPLFCSLLYDVCRSIFNKQGPQEELPKGITYMYTRLFLALMHDYHKDRKVTIDELKFIMALGRRAFTMLEKGEYFLSINYHKDGGEPVDDVEAVTYCGLSTLFYTKPLLFVEERLFSFLHPTMQEYLAALYAFLTFVNEDKNIFEPPKGKMTLKLSRNKKGPLDLYKYALERSLPCEDGKLDIFMRFLFGLSNARNTELLQQFFKHKVKWNPVTIEARALIRKKMLENQYPARVKNLEMCLEELM